MKIDKDIPMPEANKPRFDFSKMELGDSFAAKQTSTNPKQKHVTPETSAFARYCIANGWKCAKRQLVEDGVAVVRVWRVS